MQQTSTRSTSRLAETIDAVPATTLLFMSICIVTYMFQLVFEPNLSQYSIQPKAIVQDHQFYRVFTSATFHINIFHILMNMLAMYNLGSMLERRVGTSMMSLIITWLMTAGALLFIGISYALSYIPSKYFGPSMIFRQAAGFSGVVFGILLFESTLATEPTRSVYGLFSISTKLYPWILMGITQIILPFASLMGHLCGLLAAMIFLQTPIHKLFPSFPGLRNMEEGVLFRYISGHPNFIRAPNDFTFTADGNICSSVAELFYFLWSVFRPLLMCCIPSRMVRWCSPSQRREAPSSRIIMRDGVAAREMTSSSDSVSESNEMVMPTEGFIDRIRHCFGARSHYQPIPTQEASAPPTDQYQV